MLFSAPKMKAVCSSETSVSAYKSTPRYCSEDQHRQRLINCLRKVRRVRLCYMSVAVLVAIVRLQGVWNILVFWNLWHDREQYGEKTCLRWKTRSAVFFRISARGVSETHQNCSPNTFHNFCCVRISWIHLTRGFCYQLCPDTQKHKPGHLLI
jgi:hypothetical protein